MAISKWKDADTTRAREIWSEYQRNHDVSDKSGQTVGIEPGTGRVWLGASIQEVIAQRDAAGCLDPLFFMRIGSPSYYRKGGHR